jgi:hypothetical protein
MDPVASPSSTSLIKSFIADNIPEVKRISKGMVELMELFIFFKKRNQKIELDAEVFIPAKTMQNLVREYQPFRDACFLMKGYNNHLSGKCDLITGYTEAFDALFISLLKAQYLFQSTLSPLYLVNKELDNKNHNFELIGNLYPGADTTMYHQTEKSPRYYIWLQNLSKDHKKEVYSGCVDFDITACHPTIFFKEVLKGMTSNPYMKTMIEEPEVFIQHLIDSKIYNRLYPHLTVTDERAAAKDARSRLFNLRPDGSHRMSGIHWYDNLQAYIISEMEKMSISNPHQFFCNQERKIVEQAIAHVGADRVVLLMHDGVILKDVAYIGSLCSELGFITGYQWKATLL